MIAALRVHWAAQAVADIHIPWLRAAPLRQAAISAKPFDGGMDADTVADASTRALTGTPPPPVAHSANAMVSTSTPNA